MPSIKELKSQDFIELQDHLYDILEIVSQNEGILVEASYPLKNIKNIVDKIGETKIGVIAKNKKESRQKKRDIKHLSYFQKLERAMDPKNKDYICCDICREPLKKSSLGYHQHSAKCDLSRGRLVVGTFCRNHNITTKLLNRMIPFVSILDRYCYSHHRHWVVEQKIPYYHKYH